MPVIKQRTQFTNSSIGVSSFDTGADAVYQAASDFANQVGRIAVAEGNAAAEKRGAERAQSLTPEEVIEQSREKPKGPLLPKIEDEKFNQVLDRRFVDTIDRDIRLESKRIAQKYEDPVSYERVFGNYLRDMTEGADERFQGVVANVAKYTMADTKLDLAAAAQRKARAKLVDDLDISNNESRERAFDSANAGNDDIAISIIESRVLATQEAEDANLPIKSGASDSVKNGLAVTAMSGMMNGLLQDVDDPLEQAAISAYIRSQGTAQAGLIDPERKARIDKYMPYVNVETASKVIASIDATNSDLNQIRSIRQDRENALAEQEARQAIVNFGDQMDALDMQYSSSAIRSTNQPDLSKIRATTRNIYQDIETRTNLVDKRFVSGSIDEAERDKQTKQLNESGIRALVFAAARDGNISSLKAYITGGNPEDLPLLTSRQRTIAQSLRSSGIYSDDNRNYVEDLLSGSENSVRLAIEKEQRNANLSFKVQDLAGKFSSGVADQEQSEAVMKEIATALSSGDIGASRQQTLVDSLRAAQAKGFVNLTSTAASAFDMMALTSYIKSNGEEDSGLSDAMRLAGDQILASTPEGKRKEVGNHANGLRVQIENKEREAQVEIEKQQLRTLVSTGNGVATDKKHREAADEVLELAGINITDPSSKTEAVYDMMRGAPPQSLIDGLSNVSLGLEVEGAEVLLDHFAVMVNDPTSEGLFVNRFGTGDGAALSSAKVAFLQDVVNIRKITNKPALEIAMTLNERRADSKSKINLDVIFGEGVSPKQYVEKTYGPIIAEDLGDAAEYFAYSNLDRKEIDSRLEAMVDTRFIKSDLVVDPRFPIGPNNRTMHSLEATFPNEDRRNAFLERIVSQLPDGYRLANSVSNVGGQGRAERRSGEAKVEDKLVYLVPSDNGIEGSYYTYFLDDLNELRPLITEQDSEPFWPMFDKSDLTSYDRNQSILSKINIIQEQNEEERRLGRVRDAKPAVEGLFPIIPIARQSFGVVGDTLSGTAGSSAGRRK